MLKMAGKLKKGTGSSDAGIEAIKDFLNSKKIDLKGFNMEDACGLSRKNKISTRQLCNILRAVKNENSFNAFYASLPVAGKSGGMAAMLKSTTAENNLRAKTGNMDKIKSYAGYVNNASGKELAFAIIFNNYTCSNAEIKQKAEKLMLLISQTK
jgi:D-alanyl-D-alanine carboxypeptidase/D-alanyl-D-alanine-endopeptidase (penicillin-binding protein 4)